MTATSGPVGKRQNAILCALADAGDRGLFPRDFAALYDPERPLESRLSNVRNNLRSLSMRGLAEHSEGPAGRNGYRWRITRKGLDWLAAPETRVFTWDYREQPPLGEILSEVRKMRGPWFWFCPETGTQEYALILSVRELKADEAERILRDSVEGLIVTALAAKNGDDR
jgi:hypothetical protein